MATVTLTFDNGPEPDVTHHVLDVLAERGITTTFFCIGEKLAQPGSREVLARARELGHAVGSHSFSHRVALGENDDPRAFDDEVTRTHDALGALASPGRLFRPYCNAGHIDHRVLKREHVARLIDGRYTLVMFDAAVWDWEDADGWVERALAEVAARDWTMLVLHDIVGYPPGTVTHGMRQLPRFLDALASAGHVVTSDFKPEAVPIVDGRLVGAIDHLCT